MFDKLTKMQLAQCGGFFLASYIGAALGTIWILQPWMDGTAASFAYAPGITFSMAACLAWAKALDQVICKPLCSDNASLLMTLPVSEEDFVDSRILLGAGGSTLFYLCIGMGVLCMTGLQDGLEFTFTSLSAMFIDLSYGPWTGAISFGLIPVIVFLVQVLTSMMLLMIVLKCRKHIMLQKNSLRYMPCDTAFAGSWKYPDRYKLQRNDRSCESVDFGRRDCSGADSGRRIPEKAGNPCTEVSI